jgi:hypothetical protein
MGLRLLRVRWVLFLVLAALAVAACAVPSGGTASPIPEDGGDPADEARDAATDTSLDATTDAAIDTVIDTNDGGQDARPDTGVCAGAGLCDPTTHRSIVPNNSLDCGLDSDSPSGACQRFCELENPGSPTARCQGLGEFGYFMCRCD